MQEGGTGTRAGLGFTPPRPPLTRAIQIPHPRTPGKPHTHTDPHAVQIPNPRRAISAYHTRAHAGIRYTTILYSSIQYSTIHYYTVQNHTIPARERVRKQGRREYVRDK